jgi:uncharacterized protein
MTDFLSPPFEPDLTAALVVLNNAHAEELSYKSPGEFESLIRAASLVLAEAGGLALLVAFNETSSYENPNFAWFKSRFPRFCYIDRVVVDHSARGRGIARQLYSTVAVQARRDGSERLVCEINSDPPNPQSDAFHEALGFCPIGKQELIGTGKTVRYWCLELSSPTSPA